MTPSVSLKHTQTDTHTYTQAGGRDAQRSIGRPFISSYCLLLAHPHCLSCTHVRKITVPLVISGKYNHCPPLKAHISGIAASVVLFYDQSTTLETCTIGLISPEIISPAVIWSVGSWLKNTQSTFGLNPHTTATVLANQSSVRSPLYSLFAMTQGVNRPWLYQKAK